MLTKLKKLRSYTLAYSFFDPLSLSNALQKLQFVQADPIRSPARAQDLILRHRVANYHAGDLEAAYPTLDIEEDFLYAYGFLTREIWRLLNPKRKVALTKIEKEVLRTVQRKSIVHPRDLDAVHGRKRVFNAWGGYSQATKRALEKLHYYGYLRVAKRRKGVRVYAPAESVSENGSLQQRLATLILTTVAILAPVSIRTLQEALYRQRRTMGDTKKLIEKLLRQGRLTKIAFDSHVYVLSTEWTQEEQVHDRVRFLAPFDPLVWDRRRFAHFWGWEYRFEAYVPKHKRVRGYYAMPLLWREEIIGWVNVSKNEKKLDIDLGYVDKQPTSTAFTQALEEEISQMESFLK